MESFFAGLIGFLIGRGVAPRDATSIVQALEKYLGFEPPLGLTGYALKDMEQGKNQKSAVVVRGKTYHATALQDVLKHEAVSVLGKQGAYLQVAPQIRARITEKGYESHIFKVLRTEASELEPQGTETLLDLPNRDVTLERLVLGTNYNGMTLKVYAYNIEEKEGEYLPTVQYKGEGWYIPQPYTINLYKSDIWEELVYDEAGSKYKFALKRPLRFANGVKVEVRNPHPTESYRVAVTALATIR